MVDDTSDDSIILHLAKLLNQHFLRNPLNCALKIGEAQDVPPKELEQDLQLPAPLKVSERVFNTLRGGFARVLM